MVAIDTKHKMAARRRPSIISLSNKLVVLLLVLVFRLSAASGSEVLRSEVLEPEEFVHIYYSPSPSSRVPHQSANEFRPQALIQTTSSESVPISSQSSHISAAEEQLPLQCHGCDKDVFRSSHWDGFTPWDPVRRIRGGDDDVLPAESQVDETSVTVVDSDGRPPPASVPTSGHQSVADLSNFYNMNETSAALVAIESHQRPYSSSAAATEPSHGPHSRMYSVFGKDVDKINVFDPPDFDLIDSIVHSDDYRHPPKDSDKDGGHHQDPIYINGNHLHDSYQVAISHDPGPGHGHFSLRPHPVDRGHLSRPHPHHPHGQRDVHIPPPRKHFHGPHGRPSPLEVFGPPHVRRPHLLPMPEYGKKRIKKVNEIFADNGLEWPAIRHRPGPRPRPPPMPIHRTPSSHPRDEFPIGPRGGAAPPRLTHGGWEIPPVPPFPIDTTTEEEDHDHENEIEDDHENDFLFSTRPVGHIESSAFPYGGHGGHGGGGGGHGSDESCPLKEPIHCETPSLYRTYDGSCNNPGHARWGKSYECLDRILPPVYHDGRVAPKRSAAGGELPPARIVSNAVHASRPLNAQYTHMVMQFGQILTHDISWTPLADNLIGLGGISCCPTYQHRECYPIVIPPGDPVYGVAEPNRTCNAFVRSEPCESCFATGYRDQVTQQTAFIDASNIYGARSNDSWAIRSRDGSGQLIVSRDVHGRPLLPRARSVIDVCTDRDGVRNCFMSGDQRVNQHPGLTCLATIFMRQHNRLARGLRRVNPHWDGERLFQAARRILGAQLQVITYKEYLPLLLGNEILDRYGLRMLAHGHSHYDPKTNPSILTEFATAAFRWGHSTIQGTWAKVDGHGGLATFNLKDRYFQPVDIIGGRMDSILRGLIYQPSEEFDTHVADDVRNHLYKPRRSPVGPDLAAQNIQRGRDHGIPGYVAYVKQCLGQVAIGHTWHELANLFRPEMVPILQRLYPNIADLDLFTGGMAEKPIMHSLVGPVFSCIIGNQFNKLKYGDRYYLEHGGQDGSFSSGQLRSLRQTSLAKLLCANGDDFPTIQPNVFLFPGSPRGGGGGVGGGFWSSSSSSSSSHGNDPVPCSRLADLDLTAWKES